ncbi:hypothetical protein MNBD_GAMMA04-2188 [hydrothermal vent metagenome]|uniref:DUF72 domain-containing protein n=1 Tax=hydrothermal vent metagenome TaxID=652676 RepID=A0A3B0WFD8_9ZZZZ
MVELQIGTYGWRHDDWVGDFYPDDLPEAWQLDYFSNVYRVVLVPQAEWCTWSQQTKQEIAESMEESFGLYLALDNDLNGGVKNRQILSQLEDIVSSLGDSILGVVVWSESPFTSLALLPRPITLISSQYVLSGWQWCREGVKISGNPFGWIEQLPENGKKQAALLTDFVASFSDDDHAKRNVLPFIVGGEEINMEQVANLKTISELLGY